MPICICIVCDCVVGGTARARCGCQPPAWRPSLPHGSRTAHGVARVGPRTRPTAGLLLKPRKLWARYWHRPTPCHGRWSFAPKARPCIQCPDIRLHRLRTVFRRWGTGWERPRGRPGVWATECPGFLGLCSLDKTMSFLVSLTLIHDLWAWFSIPDELWSMPIHMQKLVENVDR